MLGPRARVRSQFWAVTIVAILTVLAALVAVGPTEASHPASVSRVGSVSLPGLLHLTRGSTVTSASGHPTVPRSGVSKSPPPLPTPPDSRESTNPLLPATIRPAVEDEVDPYALYSQEPAPMGMGDFGVSPDGAYSLSTSAVEANVSWDEFEFRNASLGSTADDNTFQLNVVLTFSIGENLYAYWVQDVAFMGTGSPNLPTINFIDNVWNLSAPGASMTDSSISGNGTVSVSDGIGFYYAEANDSLPGNNDTLAARSSLQMLVTTGLTVDDQPEVVFEYNDSATGGHYVVFDQPVITFARLGSGAVDYQFLIDGFAYNPARTFYDAEIIAGGPGGGSKTVPVSGSDFNLTLLEFNGNNFQFPLNTYNFGSDTAEGVSDTSSMGEYYIATGSLFASLGFDSTESASTEPDPLYNQTEVGLLNVTDTASATGYVVVGGAAQFAFQGGSALLTLAPGSYTIEVGASLSTLASLGTCTVGYETYDIVNQTTGCAGATPSVYITSLWSEYNPANVGQTTELVVGAMVDGTPTYAWSGLPTNCTSQDASAIPCTPTVGGDYLVTVTVSVGQQSEVAQISLKVGIVPLAATLTAAPSPATVGSAVTFTTDATGGTGGYTYGYTGLPTGCSTADLASLPCTPAAVGTYTITVTVTDSSSDMTTAQVQLTVNPSGQPLAVFFTISPNPATAGRSITLTTTASGGTPPYTYEYLGLPPGCAGSTASSFSCTPSTAGSYTVEVEVTDSVNSIKSAQNSLVVNPSTGGSSGTGGFAGLPLSLTDLILILIVVVIIIGIVAVASSRRGPPPSGAPPPAMYGAGGYPPTAAGSAAPPPYSPPPPAAAPPAAAAPGPGMSASPQWFTCPNCQRPRPFGPAPCPTCGAP